MNDEAFMQAAINACRAGIAKGQSPFGACIVREGEIIIATHNHVWLTTDITAHAEVHAIRGACTKLKSIKLTGCDMYTTTEPCPMCFSAIHWAGMRRIIYGSSIADAKAFGFSELEISNEQMKKIGGSPLLIVKDVRRDECVKLFEEWQNRPDHRVY
ncbi:MAG: nucleoside deaminase [Phycisphaeraceae bacterium]